MVEDDTPPPPSPLPQIGTVTLRELFISLRAGWWDFKAAPGLGLFFSAVYVVTGTALVWFGAGSVAWTLLISLGFPLVAPFAAVGYYEISRRLEDGERLDWRKVLGVVLAEKDRQIPWVGAIIVIYFLFWTFLAHMIFALFMGPSAMTNATSSFDIYLTREGMTMVAVEFAVGGVFAFVLFALTVVSLPLLLEKEIDFITAMLLSFAMVRRNLPVMLVWAFIISALLFVGMLPYFLGLLVVLPVLGHATWHLYRRALYDPA
ncbi:MAG: DUF2189 domain-containing protein [Rhodobacteraceae bacterium]|nr:DUF2189 domain-containing protein [Paracoccaceae bacterium]